MSTHEMILIAALAWPGEEFEAWCDTLEDIEELPCTKSWMDTLDEIAALPEVDR